MKWINFQLADEPGRYRPAALAVDFRLERDSRGTRRLTTSNFPGPGLWTIARAWLPRKRHLIRPEDDLQVLRRYGKSFPSPRSTGLSLRTNIAAEIQTARQKPGGSRVALFADQTQSHPENGQLDSSQCSGSLRRWPSQRFPRSSRPWCFITLPEERQGIRGSFRSYRCTARPWFRRDSYQRRWWRSQRDNQH